MTTIKKTVILVADVKNWAFDNIAQYVAGILDEEYECHILYTSEYKDHENFLHSLAKLKKIDFMHFFYRGYLTELLNVISRKNPKKHAAQIEKFLSAACVTNIPDHLFLRNNKELLRHVDTFNFVDNYYTVSQVLYDIYSNISYYPKPYKVIYDNIIIKNAKPDLAPHNRELVITWVGNSQWGEWKLGIGYDFKGFKSVVLPTFKMLEQNNIAFKKNITDSNQIKRTKEEVYSILQKTDILLISSESEGTPLPLIEAMSYGCAIVSTDIGIASEILPDIQKPFIVSRDPHAFVSAIKKINKPRDLLFNIKKQNYEAYQNIFCRKEKFKELWCSLIEDSIAKMKSEDRVKEKKKIIDNIKKINSFVIPSIHKRLYKKIINSDKVRRLALHIIKYPFVQVLLKKIFQRVNSHNLNSNFNDFIVALRQSSLTNNPMDNVFAICSTYYPGVANSTIGLFDKTLPLPSSRFIEYVGLPDKVITQITNSLFEMRVQNLIISGGSKVQIQLVEKLNKLATATSKINIYFLWHGSPAQWVNNHHCENFYKILNLYKENKFKAIITLKKDLEKVLIAQGVQSYLLQNFVPPKPHDITPSEKRDEFRIGIWSAYSIWVKNLHPQFMAVKILDNNISCYTNYNFNSYDSWILENIDHKLFPAKLPHSELMKHMTNTDLTLYVTNTECSPMIALESLSLGVPCLVGPTSALFDTDQYLKDMLTVTRVDCAFAISQAIEKVRNNYNDIISRIPSFVEKYNQEAAYLKESFIKEINQ
jgi:glycosyltransferase involved in cell wall biosynthesis